MTEITAQEKKSTSFYIKRITGLILLLALATVFSYSAYTKIGAGEGVDPFAWTFIDMGINSQLWAGVIARVMVGMEMLIAALLVCHIFLRSFTYPFTIAVLVIFTIYLVIQIALHGNTGNCGCFGEELEMTPLNAIWKNLVMIAVTISLYYLYPVKPYKHQDKISIFIGLVAIALPFVLDPINASSTPKPENKQIILHALYEKEQKPRVELRTGKHIVAFMSLTCPHCKKAAKKFAIVHENNPEIPLFFVLAGNPKNLKPFFDETKSEKVPHVLFRDPENFLKMAGSGVPAIFYINNSVIEYEANYFQLDPQFMKEWLRK
jgi:thiol-disulfide isomerase/thioredoxin